MRRPEITDPDPDQEQRPSRQECGQSGSMTSAVKAISGAISSELATADG